MEDIISKLPGILEQASVYLSAIVAIATVLVRLPFLSKQEESVNKAIAFVQKILSYLPTLGINPKTKVLEDKAKNG